MSHFQKDYRVPRRRVLRSLFTRRGLILRLHVETDSPAFVAHLDPDPPPRQKPRWHEPDETWRLA